jgi:SAM-dependent methyltransferase
MEPAEVARLERQHEVWRAETDRLWDRAGFASGQVIVDLGSGPGFTSLDLANRVGPAGRVVAVDRSPAAVAHVRTVAQARSCANLDIVAADVLDADLASLRPDGIFSRWLFCYLAEPDAVARRSAEALAPGGRIAVVDYWNYLAIRSEPDSAIFRRTFRAVFESFADAGGSLEVGGKLPGWLHAAGLRVTAIDLWCQAGGPASPVWRWIAEFQDLYLPTLVPKGYLSRADVDEHLAWWREQEQSASALVFGPPMLAVVGTRR